MLLPFLDNVSEQAASEVPLFAAHDPIDILSRGWLSQFNIWTILIRIVLALAVGIVFGLERSRKRHTAGLRTFSFVSLFSAIATLLDVYLMSNFKVVFPAITAAVVLGGAIIAGNTLLYSSKSQIKGLTTAVALWLMSIFKPSFLKTPVKFAKSFLFLSSK